MKIAQKFLMVLFFIGYISHSENIYARYYGYSSSCYLAWEVFDMVEHNDVYEIENWLRTYPRTVDIRNNDGQTPFMVAVYLQHYTIANKLLRAGANRYARDNYGRTARDYMYDRDFHDTISQSLSSDTSSIVAALGVGAIVGLAAYALSGGDDEYDAYRSSSECYCPGCGATRYAGESLYCSCCR